MDASGTALHKQPPCTPGQENASRPALHTHNQVPRAPHTSLSSLGMGSTNEERRRLGTGEISLNVGQREVQIMSALGKKPFHPTDLLKEGTIFISFVLKALESKI